MASSSVVGLLKVLLTADTAQFSAEMKRVSDSARVWEKDLQSIGRQATTIGAALTKSITVPLVGIAGASIKAFSDFDDAMTKSTAIMGTLSSAMRNDLEAAAREVGRTTTFSAKQAADAYFFLASAGLDAKQSIAALPLVAKFAQAGNFDLARATDLLTDAQSALGLTIRDDVVKNMQNMVKVSDVLVKANVLANATVQQFSESLTTRAGAALRLVNKDIEEGVAVLAAFADQGTKGAEAGTRLDIVLRDLQKASINQRGEFERLGITVFDSAGNMRNMADIIGDMEGAFVGMSDEQKRSTITMLGFQDRSVAAILSLLGFSDAIRNYETQLRSAAGVTEEVASKQLESMKAQLTILWHRITDVGLTIGKALAPAVRDLAAGITAVLPILEGAAKLFSALPAPIQLSVIGIGALLAVAGPAIYVFGQLALASAALTGAFTANGLATRLLTVNIGAMILSLKASVVAAAATTTAYGAMGAASIAATGALRALWAVVAAHPWVALATGIGLATAALSRWHTARVNAKQTEVTEQIKRETIAFAEQAGVVLKATDAHKRYLEAVDALQLVDAIRIAQFDKTVAAQRRALEAERELGFITRDTYNQRNLLIKGEEQAAAVREKRVTIAEVAAAKERALRLELQETGYTVAQLVAELKKNETGFNAWAKEVGLSSEAIAFLKSQIKENVAAQKESDQANKDASEGIRALTAQIARQRDMLRSLGLVTRDDATDAMRGFGDAMLAAQAHGVPLVNVLAASVPRLVELERQLRLSGVNTAEFAAQIRTLKRELEDLLGPIPKLLNVNTDPSKVIIRGLTGISGATLEAAKQTAILTQAQKTLGATSRDELERTAYEFRQAYNDMVASGKFTEAELKKARQRVLEAERAAAGETVSIWQTQIFPAVAQVGTRLQEAINGSFAQMLLGAKSFRDGFVDIWQSIKAALMNIFTQILQSFVSTVLDGILAAITGRQGGIGAALGNLFGGLFGRGGATGAIVESAGGIAGGGAAGAGAGAGGAGTGITLGGVGTALGAAGLGVAIGAGIWKGFFDNPHRPWDELTGQEEAGKFLDSMGGEESFRTFLDSLGFAADEIDGMIAPLKDEIVLGIRSSFDEAIQAIGDAIRSKGFDITDAGFNVPHLASGGYIQQPTLAMVHAGEVVAPLNEIPGWRDGGSMQPIIVELDGRTLARGTVPHIPDEIRKLRLAY